MYVHLKKNLFLVDVFTLLYMDEVIGNGNHISLYTITTIDMGGSQMSLQQKVRGALDTVLSIRITIA